jgi:hypothetical protein
VTNFAPQAPYPHYLLNIQFDYTQSHSGQFGEQMETTQSGIEQLFPNVPTLSIVSERASDGVKYSCNLWFQRRAVMTMRATNVQVVS